MVLHVRSFLIGFFVGGVVVSLLTYERILNRSVVLSDAINAKVDRWPLDPSGFDSSVVMVRKTEIQTTNTTLCQCDTTQKATASPSASPSASPTVARKNDAVPQQRYPGFCSRLPSNMSASQLWRDNFERLRRATRKGLYRQGRRAISKAEPNLWYPNWTLPLLEFLSPRFLRLGYSSPPLPLVWGKVLEMIHQRMLSPETTKPIKVAIVGGSVTEGRGSCKDGWTDWKGFSQKTLQPSEGDLCRWTRRLQQIFDEFLGRKVVQVNNIAFGGTTTSLSTTIIKYKLYNNKSPLLPDGPDVIINAYATNDALVPHHGANVTDDAQWLRSRREQAQEFIRACHDSRPCSELPLVIYLDDYLGNQHDIIMGELSNYWQTRHTSEWYGVMFLSYADAVRRLIYANQQDTYLSAYWKWWAPKSVDVHFGMSAHFAVAWVVAFGMLSATVDYCHDRYNAAKTATYLPDVFPGIIMDMVERSLPPPLDSDLRLREVSESWLEDYRANEDHKRTLCHKTIMRKVNPCVMAFIAGPMGTVKDDLELSDYLRTRAINVDGWDTGSDIGEGGWANKYGLVATKPRAKATFVVNQTHTEVQAVRLFTLKSYGEKWEHSKARFRLRGISPANKVVVDTSFQIVGFHDSNTSISFPHDHILGPKKAIPSGHRVELHVDLIGGNNFKIIGLTMCNRP